MPAASGGAGAPQPSRGAWEGRGADQGGVLQAGSGEGGPVHAVSFVVSPHDGQGSEVTRALWTLAVRSDDGLEDLVGRAPTLDRPSYGNRLAMAEYEDAIAEFLLAALKNTR